MGYPDPGDVRDGVVFGDSDEFVGTLLLPDATTVLSTASYGAGGTEFTGAWVPPDGGDVRSGTTYGNGGAEDGHCVLPAASDVRSGVGFGSDLVDPGPFEFVGTLSPSGVSKKWLIGIFD